MSFLFTPSPPSTSYTIMPMDIPTKSTRPQSPSSSCAFPSWPKRSSLSSNEDKEEFRATSFVSDDDLEDLFPCVFDDREQDCTPVVTPSRSPEAQVVMNCGELMRELIAQEKAKRERRARRRSSSFSRKSRSGSGSSKRMSPIQEVGE